MTIDDIKKIPLEILDEFGNIELCIRETPSLSLETSNYDTTYKYFDWLRDESYISNNVFNLIFKHLDSIGSQYNISGVLVNFISNKEFRLYVYMPELLGITIDLEKEKINKFKLYNDTLSKEIYYTNMDTLERKDYYDTIDPIDIQFELDIHDLFYDTYYTSQYDDNGQVYYRFANRRLCNEDGTYKYKKDKVRSH